MPVSKFRSVDNQMNKANRFFVHQGSVYYIGFPEFVALMARLSKDDEYDIESAFRVFDREGDGMIKVQELKVKALLGKSMYFW